MATLEEASRQLTDQIAELDADVESATGKLTKLRETLKNVEKQLDQRIEDLEKDVEDFVTNIQTETAQLATDLNEADQATTQTEQAVEQAGGAATSAIEAAQGQAEALTSAVDDIPEAVDAMLTDQVETPASSLGEQAGKAASAIDQAIDATSDNVSSFTESLVEMQAKIPEAASGMGDAIQMADGHIGKAFVEWTSHLFEVVDLVENKGFEPAQENAEEVATFALDECKKGLEEAVQAAFDRVNELAEEFSALQEAIDQSAGQVTSQGEQPVVSEMGELRDALTSAIDWLGTVEEWLGSYSFVKG